MVTLLPLGGPGGLSQASFAFRGLLNMHLRHFEKLKGRVKQFYLYRFLTDLAHLYYCYHLLFYSLLPNGIFYYYYYYLLFHGLNNDCYFVCFKCIDPIEKMCNFERGKIYLRASDRIFFKRILQGASPWNKVAHQVPRCSLNKMETSQTSKILIITSFRILQQCWLNVITNSSWDLSSSFCISTLCFLSAPFDWIIRT